MISGINQFVFYTAFDIVTIPLIIIKQEAVILKSKHQSYFQGAKK